MKIVSAIPTNIITGFLGVGKTTSILSLLANKPNNERWAILVNEFGEVGIDGGLITGNYPQEQGIFIKEVPGGCMCCTANLPMQIALNQLLVKAKPDRLLIEPTGLGHPKEVLEILTQPQYANVIDLCATITLLDPRKFSDSRYTENDTFQQQIEVADILVANKSDQCSDNDFSQLNQYLADNQHQEKPFYRASFGQFPYQLVEAKSQHKTKPLNPMHGLLNSNQTGVNSSESSDFELAELTNGEHLKSSNQGEGFTAIGWRFHSSIIFDYKKLFNLLSALRIPRLKGYFITDKGLFAFNLTETTLSQSELQEAFESRVEYIIDAEDQQMEEFEQQLLDCRCSNAETKIA